MPDTVPVIVLGRLAVHSDWVNHGIGKGLLKDALLRSLAIARELGARALICHAISQDAKDFYMKHGFVESPIDPMTLMLNLSKLPSTASKAEI
jgi:N-acetylglutamate synthase-like GNAT family acetyltransferase